MVVVVRRIIGTLAMKFVRLRYYGDYLKSGGHLLLLMSTNGTASDIMLWRAAMLELKLLPSPHEVVILEDVAVWGHVLRLW